MKYKNSGKKKQSYMKYKNSGWREQSYHAFLESLIGRVVTIYRGGPESKTGKLLDVQSDYVTLYDQNNNNKNNNNDSQSNQNNQGIVIYYQAEHVKSISEDSKNNSMQVTQNDEQEVEYLKSETFDGLMQELLNETVQINQGGPESKYGVLLSANEDFIGIYTQDDGVVYYNVRHIKSVCKYPNNQNKRNDKTQNQVETTTVYPSLVEASDFRDIFKHMEHNWVSINRGGPEAMEGILVENSGGHYTLVSDQEVLRVHPYHIKSISIGPKGSMNQQNQNNNQNETNAENQSSNQNMDQNTYQIEASANEDQTKRSTSTGSRSNERVVKTIDYVWKGSR